MTNYIIKWNRSAKSELKAIYMYYLKDTVQGAQLVRHGILEVVEKLAKELEVHYPFDPYLGKPFRYIKFRRYKIIHLKDPEKKEIRILGIFDTKQNPKKIHKIENRSYSYANAVHRIKALRGFYFVPGIASGSGSQQQQKDSQQLLLPTAKC